MKQLGEEANESWGWSCNEKNTLEFKSNNNENVIIENEGYCKNKRNKEKGKQERTQSYGECHQNTRLIY